MTKARTIYHEAPGRMHVRHGRDPSRVMTFDRCSEEYAARRLEERWGPGRLTVGPGGWRWTLELRFGVGDG